MANHYTTLLSIAGSDSIGGAGIQADIKTCSAFGIYAMTAITAITAQNTFSVAAILPVTPDFVCSQLDAVFSDVKPDVIKIGMLPDGNTAAAIADYLRINARRIPLVVDPVMVATAGSSLATPEVAGVIIAQLAPLATLITPNIPEARVMARLLHIRLTDQSDGEQLASQLSAKLNTAILLKGGHTATPDSGRLTDILATPDGRSHTFHHSKIISRNTHGTGCSLSSAIACGLAKGHTLPQACALAIEWLHRAITGGADYEFGHGHGPVCHFTLPNLY